MEWVCEACSYVNSPARTLCEMCASPRPKPKPGGGASGPDWQCPKCTMNNKGTASTCTTCGGAKPTTTTAPVKKPTPTNPPVTTPAAPSEADITYLVNMGFSREWSIRALKEKKNNRIDAAEWILSNPEPKPKQPESQPQPKKPEDGKGAQPKKPEEAAKKPVEPKREDPKKAQSQPKPQDPVVKPVTKPEEAKKGGASQPTVQAAKPDLDEQKREAERKALEEEERKKEQALQKKAIEMRREAAEELRKKKEQDDKEKKEAEFAKEKQREDERKAELEARTQKRLDDEKKIKDIPTALNMLKESYGPLRLAEICSMISKIINKILQNPNEAKFRTIKLTAAKTQKTLVRPFGALYIMKQLGFEEKEQSLVMAKPNLNLLKAELPRFSAASKLPETPVVKILTEIDVKAHSVETVYFALKEIITILNNVLSLPSERNFRMLEIKDDVFQRRLAPIPQSKKLLTFFGFEENKAGDFLVCEHPDLPKIEVGANEILAFASKIGAETPVYKGVLSLLRANGKKNTLYMVEKLQAATNRIMERPHELKFHKINLEKFFSHTGSVDGGYKFFELMGFKVDIETQTAKMPYPEGFDVNLLKYRAEDMDRAWKVALADMARKREERELAADRAVAGPAAADTAKPKPKTESKDVKKGTVETKAGAPSTSTATATAQRPAAKSSATKTETTTVAPKPAEQPKAGNQAAPKAGSQAPAKGAKKV